MESRPLCLLVEDQSLIGLALEASLHDTGFEVAPPLTDNRAALLWLNRHKPSVALLDYMLRDGPCLPIARQLRAKGIPFAVYSAIPPVSPLPKPLRGIPWMIKPRPETEIVRLLRELMPP